MGKIKMGEGLQNSVINMAEGNPGALVAILNIIKEYELIDPEAALGGAGFLLSLDDMEIYGSDIYVLFSDKCGGDIRRMIMLLRASQLGFLSRDKIKEMSKDQMRSINLSEDEYLALDDKVCERLDKFKRR